MLCLRGLQKARLGLPRSLAYLSSPPPSPPWACTRLTALLGCSLIWPPTYLSYLCLCSLIHSFLHSTLAARVLECPGCQGREGLRMNWAVLIDQQVGGFHDTRQSGQVLGPKYAPRGVVREGRKLREGFCCPRATSFMKPQLPCQHRGSAEMESQYCFHVFLPANPKTPHLLGRDLWR